MKAEAFTPDVVAKLMALSLSVLATVKSRTPGPLPGFLVLDNAARMLEVMCMDQVPEHRYRELLELRAKARLTDEEVRSILEQHSIRWDGSAYREEQERVPGSLEAGSFEAACLAVESRGGLCATGQRQKVAIVIHDPLFVRGLTYHVEITPEEARNLIMQLYFVCAGSSGTQGAQGAHSPEEG